MKSEALAWLFNTVRNTDWLEVVKTFASVATVAVAYFALKNWKRQDKAKREAEFLDALIEATHAFIIEMGRSIAFVRVTRIGMMSHALSFDESTEAENIRDGAVPYIQQNGERDAKRLIEALNEVRPLSVKLRSLSTKGQVFAFADYAKCQKGVAILVWQCDRIEALASIVGSPSLNWKHPEVEQALQNVLTVEPDDMEKHLAENNVAILDFAKKAYARLYGPARKTARR